MANRIFKNEKSFFGKLEAIFWKFWAKEGFRFLVIGAVNSLVGLIVTIAIRYLLEDVWHIIFTIEIINGHGVDLPNLIMFGLLFSYSYTMQARFVFRTKWNVGRCFLYLLSSIPNVLLQQLFITLFIDLIGLPYVWGYTLATICPIPFMYFINKILIKPFKKKPAAVSEKK